MYQFLSSPGIRRDGTAVDSDFYTDGVWVRWQRGKPRKMGGYRAMSTLANGPVRSVLVDSRNGINSAHYFSQYGIQRQQFSASGAGGSVDDRTPIGFYQGIGDPLLTWSHGVMTSSTGGSFSALLAASSPDIEDISRDTGGNLFTGDIAGTEPLTVLSDATGPISVSGGVTVLQPFAVVYGSNGLIRNSAANNLTVAGWTPGTGFANIANVAGTKFVYGAPVRGGSQSPAGLFWALDALVRMSFIGGTNFWQYDTLSQPTSILSKKGVVEHDGRFFWPGTDRFLFYNGVVQELPNQMNSNWFYENLNYAHRNKVWGTKIPRWGEIWWFYPRGASTECNNAVIFNYVENTWYDAVKDRSAGGQVQVFPFPIWAGPEDRQLTTVLTIGFPLTTSAQTASGNATLTFTSTTGVANGQVISGPGIAPGTTVSSFTGTTVVMSAVSTAIIPIGTAILFSSMTSPIAQGSTVTGSTTAATGKVARASLQYLNLISVTGTFNNTETLTATPSGTAISRATPFTQSLETIYQQEFGVDKTLGQDITAVISSFTSKQFGFAVGAPFADAAKTVDVMTRISRLDLDFNQRGPLNISVLGRSYAQQADTVLETQVPTPTSDFVEFREQERIIAVKVESNVIGGFFEQGQVMMKLEPGDERSTKNVE